MVSTVCSYIHRFTPYPHSTVADVDIGRTHAYYGGPYSGTVSMDNDGEMVVKLDYFGGIYTSKKEEEAKQNEQLKYTLWGGVISYRERGSGAF